LLSIIRACFTNGGNVNKKRYYFMSTLLSDGLLCLTARESGYPLVLQVSSGLANPKHKAFFNTIAGCASGAGPLVLLQPVSADSTIKQVKAGLRQTLEAYTQALA